MSRRGETKTDKCQLSSASACSHEICKPNIMSSKAGNGNEIGAKITNSKRVPRHRVRTCLIGKEMEFVLNLIPPSFYEI